MGLIECVGCSLTSGHQERPGHTPYTRGDHGTCGGAAGLVVPGPPSRCLLLGACEKL